MPDKKWKTVLLCFYHYFKNCREPISPQDLFDYEYRFFRDHDILTPKALHHHTSRLAKRDLLYAIYDRSKPIHHGIARCYLLSKAGVKRLAYEGLIEKEEAERLLSHIYYVADEARSDISTGG